MTGCSRAEVRGCHLQLRNPLPLCLQAAMAAKLAAEGASPLHTEPHTPELAPGELRSPSFPVSSRCISVLRPVLSRDNTGHKRLQKLSSG